MPIPAHLYRRQGIYYFRWVLPEALRELLVGDRKSEVRVSLKTTCRATSTIRAFHHWERALDAARQAIVHQRQVSYKQLVDQITYEEGAHVKKILPINLSVIESPPQSIAARLGTYDLKTVQCAIAALRDQNAMLFVSVSVDSVMLMKDVCFEDSMEYQAHERIEPFSDDFAILLTVTVTQAVGARDDSFSFFAFHSLKPVARFFGGGFYLVQADQEIIRNVTSICAYPADIARIMHLLAPPQSNVMGQRLDHLLLSDALSHWLAQNTSDSGFAGKWKPSTRKSAESSVRLFIEIVGDKLAHVVTSQDATKFLHALSTMPPNRSKMPVFRELSAGDASEKNRLTKGSAISRATVSGYIVWCSTFFNDLKLKNCCSFNPFDSVNSTLRKSGKKTNPLDARNPFSDDQIKIIFESSASIKLFARAKKSHAANVWVPLLALYTGARLSELCELRISQIIAGDTVYLNIFDFDGKGRIKTAASERQIPVHPKLIQMGFLSFVAQEKNKVGGDPQAALFPSLPAGQKETMRPVSRFFNDTLLRKLGIKTNKLNFHSFRHTVVQKFKLADTNTSKRDAFMGHSNGGSEGDKRYGEKFAAKDLSSLTAYLDYPVDWTGYSAILQKGSD